jgi:photosynthetic reaction center cytochrome c subunit
MNGILSTARLKSLVVVALLVALTGCERPPPESVQQGFRGTGMVSVVNPRLQEEKLDAISIPEPLPEVAATGTTAGQVYQNLQVLGDLDLAEFTRFMATITAWVAPEQGCNYCHEAADLASDALYTKVVSRRMIEMTRHINSQWGDHVGQTGVTCFTCHQGQNVPGELWVSMPTPPRAAGMTASSAGQNRPAEEAGLSSLPADPFTAYLLEDGDARVQSSRALPVEGDSPDIKHAEETYATMMHISTALGVNCTYCHNSRAFGMWEESTPARATAWHGIRMARDLNTNYLAPLASALPAERLGPLGDAPKANCGTCHRGLNKPLNGANMLQFHPALIGQE